MGNEEVSFAGMLDDIEGGDATTFHHYGPPPAAGEVCFKQLRVDELAKWVLSFGGDWDRLVQGAVLRMLLKLEGLE